MMRKQPYKFLEVRLSYFCNYNCSWCNQRADLHKPMHDTRDGKRVTYGKKMRSADEWISGLNGYLYKKDYMELVFSGGEPSLHPDFLDIVTEVKGFRSKKLVTNLSFDVRKLVKKCKENKTSIIVQPSFHFEEADFNEFLDKMKLLDSNALLSKIRPCSIVDLPDRDEPKIFRDRFLRHGYRAALYGFEGYYKGEFYSGDINGFGMEKEREEVICLTTVNVVKPNGDVVFCVTDAYLDDVVIYGNICDKNYLPISMERICERYGKCHISAAAFSWIKQINSSRSIWKGDNYLEINPSCQAIKNILRPLFRNKSFLFQDKRFSLKEYLKYIKLHSHSV